MGCCKVVLWDLGTGPMAQWAGYCSLYFHSILLKYLWCSSSKLPSFVSSAWLKPIPVLKHLLDLHASETSALGQGAAYVPFWMCDSKECICLHLSPISVGSPWNN